MKKILENPNYINREGYSGLDLSSSVTFTSTVGYLMPISWDFLQPGDKVKLQCNLLSRTSPLLSSAFAKIEQNVAYYFVPMSQIYKPFEQLFHGIQDYGSDMYQSYINGGTIDELLPRLSFTQIVNWFKTRTASKDNHAVFQAVRLLECLGLPMQRVLSFEMNKSDSSHTWQGHSVNILPLLAYHKIWSDYYRDTDRIPNKPSLYNADSLVNGSALPANRIDELFSLHSVPMFKDMANNLYVSPLFGEHGVGGDGADTLKQVNNWLTSTKPLLIKSDNTQDNSNPTTIGNTVSGGTYTTNINVASIRAAFATNKLLEITRRAKKHYDAQILAHFGVKVPQGVDGEAIEIGKHTQELDIGAVIATAATEGASLGEIGGKGYSSQTSGVLKFEAKTHGVLMAVYFARPMVNYYQTGIDKKLAYTRVSDFPKQEYDTLGMQPVFAMNQYLYNDAVRNSEIPGWQWRYSEVKDKLDLNILGTARTLKNWTVSRTPVYDSQDGRFEDWYVSPMAMNQIMEIPYSEDWRFDEDPESGSIPITETDTIFDMLDLNLEDMFDTDPLLNQLRLNYQKSSKLNLYGIEQL